MPARPPDRRTALSPCVDLPTMAAWRTRWASAVTARLLAVGETMAMVAPTAAVALAEATDFLVDAGGAESNVAGHVAALGHRAVWFSRLGADALGDRVLRQLGERGIDVSTVVRDRERPTGVYFKDPGRGVIYHRAGSAASALSPDDADAVALGGLRILHGSGITAALSPTAAAFLDRLIDRCRAAGVTVGFDVNHRPPLWPTGKAAEPLLALARRADIVFVGRDEAEELWGTAAPDDIRALLPEVPEVVVKDGDTGATAYSADDAFFEPSLPVEVVEAVGAGDAFAGGYLAACLDGGDATARLRAGHARAAIALRSTMDS